MSSQENNTDSLVEDPLSSSTEGGITIGSFNNCTYIADGITSDVYRSDSKALKVITATQNLEPHNPQREIKVLQSIRSPHIINLVESFRDQHQRLVLVFPFMPLTLEKLLLDTSISSHQICSIFSQVLDALVNLHSQDIIHRDIKPSAILLASPTGPAYLSDFGTAWHPDFSKSSEPPTEKILDIGTGPYRAPETLFVDKAYGTGVDIWGFGVMFAEAISKPSKPPFESRSAHEDGNQLGLILSIFKTLGTPTRDSWPEATSFKVSPFEMWTVFPTRSWNEILQNVDDELRDVVAATIRYSGRYTAQKV